MAAQSVPPMKLELPSKPVQELVKSSGNQVPERYIFHPNNESKCELTNGSNLPLMDSPVIDLHLLLDSSSPHSQEELQKIRAALSSWGCFQVINHGVASSLLEKVREVGKEFFARPLEEKQKYSRSVDWFEGYGNDAVAEDQPIQWSDRLHLRIYPANQRNIKLWPDNVPKFRETLDAYSLGMRNVLEVMLKYIAKSLNLEENIFLDHFGEDGEMFSRFNFYPPCPSPDRVLGLKPHSDGTFITILLQDEEVEGLQVEKDNQWYKVPIIPDALFINIGDQLEIMSNGLLKSPVHKVVIGKDRQRMSVAVPCIPNQDKEVGPLSELIDKERPQLYKKMNNYVNAFFLPYFARGERAILAMRV